VQVVLKAFLEQALKPHPQRFSVSIETKGFINHGRSLLPRVGQRLSHPGDSVGRQWQRLHCHRIAQRQFCKMPVGEVLELRRMTRIAQQNVGFIAHGEDD
jgi:hypothetical protein